MLKMINPNNNGNKVKIVLENTKNLQQIFPTFDEQLNNIFAKIGI